jgi:hypothetical protein
MANGMKVERAIHPVLSGSAGMAGRNGLGGVLLSSGRRTAERRAVWLFIADQAIRCIHSGQHRRRSRTGEYTKLRPISSHRARVAEGIGDAPAASGTPRIAGQSEHRRSNGTMRCIGQTVALPYPVAATQNCATFEDRKAGIKRRRPRDMRLGQESCHSQFTIRYSPFATRQLLGCPHV